MLSTSDDTDLEEVRAISPDQRLENAGRNVELAVSSRLSLLKVVRMPPLRAYYRHRFARIGHGPTEAEDLLQEALIAVHTYRHTYDRSQPFTPLDPCDRSLQISRLSPADEGFVQGHTDGERAGTHV